MLTNGPTNGKRPSSEINWPSLKSQKKKKLIKYVKEKKKSLPNTWGLGDCLLKIWDFMQLSKSPILKVTPTTDNDTYNYCLFTP